LNVGFRLAGQYLVVAQVAPPEALMQLGVRFRPEACDRRADISS